MRTLRDRWTGLARWAAGAALALGAAAPAGAHPHVFIDGGVDMVFGQGGVLEALDVTWIYDDFETLYTLSSHGLALNADGGLDPADRRELVARLSEWPEDFDGSAHLSIGGDAIGLAWPTDLDADVVDGRLRMTFTRRLDAPRDLSGGRAEIGFYERTYFFAFEVTETPRLAGDAAGCAARVIPFEADAETAEIRTLLAALGREDTPEMGNVGARLADRIVVTCD